ncbi:N-acetylglucosamine-6-phosphate deacetylase [Lachnellula arida]|uniref:N-acetylglucosamine-6-phosphate deacetylase n=1 Tax=Lachnellula arida TaxID=1316785 RepID=A0A8T9B3X7_9HELO|nr:N-acetylglucosamine-6-phosphate deacetylase [Lachnellula arida]
MDTRNRTPIQFYNCRQCMKGQLVSLPLTVNTEGTIIPNWPLPPLTTRKDVNHAIISPGFIELQINGAPGFHFAHFKDQESYQRGVKTLARNLPSKGVTGFYPTVPTVAQGVFHDVLPFLKPHDGAGQAAVLGAHVEGPFLAPSKAGAHDCLKLQVPGTTTPETFYSALNLVESIRLITLAPELPGALDYIKTLTEDYGIHVSMGHSAATFEVGKKGIEAGANLVTHTSNAMLPLHHREPGLAGLISERKPPYFSLIADQIHLHPRVVVMVYRSSPSHCILITDSIELSGLPDGIYPGHAQIPLNQVKAGNKVTIEGTETLIGTCIGLDECVRNLMEWAGIELQEAVMCVTENVADAMGLEDRGKLEVGRRADFVILEDDGTVKETWILGEQVFNGV